MRWQECTPGRKPTFLPIRPDSLLWIGFEAWRMRWHRFNQLPGFVVNGPARVDQPLQPTQGNSGSILCGADKVPQTSLATEYCV